MKNILLSLILLLSFRCSAQNWVWAKSGNEPHPFETIGASVCTDVNGNVIVTGYFSSDTIIFDSTTLTNTGLNNFYVIKYNPAGHVLWAKTASGWMDPKSVCTDINGNIYITGNCLGDSVSFDTVSAGSTGSNNVFIVKYDLNGNPLWAKVAGVPSGSGYDVGRSLVCDGSGNVIITGWFEGPSIKFGAYTLFTPPGYSFNGFLVKYDPAGNVIWAKNTGAAQTAYGSSAGADGTGNIYVAGTYYTAITFGSTMLTNNDTSGNTTDIFLAKYDPAGSLVWVKNVGGQADDWAFSITTDFMNNVYMTGSFGSASLTLGSSVFNNAGSSDVFIVKYDPSGNVLWAKSAGGPGRDEGYSICSNNLGNIYVSGWFTEPTNIFDSTLSASGGLDVFAVKFNSAGNMLCATSIACNGFFQTGSVATDQADNAYLTGAYNHTFAVGSDSLYGKGMYLIKYDCNSMSTGLDGLKTKQQVNIYPNPSSGVFTLELSSQNKTQTTICIHDLLGNCILNKVMLNSREEVDLSAQSKGIYFMEVMSVGEREVKKIVVQ